jgi:hypothetical protein
MVAWLSEKYKPQHFRPKTTKRISRRLLGPFRSVRVDGMAGYLELGHYPSGPDGGPIRYIKA